MVRRPDGTDVGEAVARSLLAGQHPDLAGRPLVRFHAGLDNLPWRLATTSSSGCRGGRRPRCAWRTSSGGSRSWRRD